MINPIDTVAVILDDRVTGTVPGSIHLGVAWWVGACFVVTAGTSKLVVAHDGHPASVEFAGMLARGAINAQGWRCQVADIGRSDVRHAATEALGGVPAVWVDTATADGVDTVTIRLWAADGALVTGPTGLDAIRAMIDADNVPLPVNEPARGRIHDRRDLTTNPNGA